MPAAIFSLRCINTVATITLGAGLFCVLQKPKEAAGVGYASCWAKRCLLTTSSYCIFNKKTNCFAAATGRHLHPDFGSYRCFMSIVLFGPLLLILRFTASQKKSSSRSYVPVGCEAKEGGYLRQKSKGKGQGQVLLMPDHNFSSSPLFIAYPSCF